MLPVQALVPDTVLPVQALVQPAHLLSSCSLAFILTVVWVLQKRPSQGDHPAEGDLAVHRGMFCRRGLLLPL